MESVITSGISDVDWDVIRNAFIHYYRLMAESSFHLLVSGHRHALLHVGTASPLL
jgi:hypothetical protein